ncbi:VOC family protein [Hirschia litorea]|uniref:VOC family protein n=1 Tax=Hirschia litorea TaxID=1199156 RepID=A0ABW2IGS5_9PROT
MTKTSEFVKVILATTAAITLVACSNEPVETVDVETPEAVVEQVEVSNSLQFNPLDSMSPKSQREDALALPLQTVTLSTTDFEGTKRFYVDGMGMTLNGPFEVSAETKALQRALWAVPDDVDWTEYSLTRPSGKVQDRGAMSIRVLVLNKETPHVHASWDSRSYGGFSMGFPNMDNVKLDAKIRALGFTARNEHEIYEVPRLDGSMYEIQETIFDAPDYVHGVGITRVDMDALGAIDAETGLGGPGYSAQVVDDSVPVLAFYTDVLGLEIRRDSIFKSAGQDGAMSLPNGSEFRFAILAAKGYGPGGHMLFVDFKNVDGIEGNAPPRVPNRGIGMWSFPVKSLDTVMANAKTAGTNIVHEPALIDDPIHGKIRVATFLAPNEFLVEAFEKVES